MNRHLFDDSLRARLERNLGRLAHAPARADGLKAAAVCMIVTANAEGEAALLLTRRAGHLSAHSGQFALPGGRVDPGETALEAGLREAREEIALELAPEAVLGRLDDFPTRSGYLITPIVAWCAPDAPMRANPDEVAQIYRVPLSDLGKTGSPQFVDADKGPHPIIRYPLLGTLIHAPTAALLYQFMEVALHGRDTRVAHLAQPDWAAR
jgi:8-oxo-dGTP pyrophosphatase MutT (NUDIX family)